MVTILDTFGTVCSHVGMNITMSQISQIVKGVLNPEMPDFFLI